TVTKAHLRVDDLGEIRAGLDRLHVDENARRTEPRAEQLEEPPRHRAAVVSSVADEDARHRDLPRRPFLSVVRAPALWFHYAVSDTLMPGDAEGGNPGRPGRAGSYHERRARWSHSTSTESARTSTCPARPRCCGPYATRSGSPAASSAAAWRSAAPAPCTSTARRLARASRPSRRWRTARS